MASSLFFINNSRQGTFVAFVHETYISFFLKEIYSRGSWWHETLTAHLSPSPHKIRFHVEWEAYQRISHKDPYHSSENLLPTSWCAVELRYPAISTTRRFSSLMHGHVLWGLSGCWKKKHCMNIEGVFNIKAVCVTATCAAWYCDVECKIKCLRANIVQSCGGCFPMYCALEWLWSILLKTSVICNFHISECDK